MSHISRGLFPVFAFAVALVMLAPRPGFAESCHCIAMSPKQTPDASGAAPRLNVVLGLTTRYAGFSRTVGAGQVASLIPGIAISRGPFAIYGDIALSTRTLRGMSVSGAGNPTFGASGTWWASKRGASDHRLGVSLHADGMAPADDDQLLGDDHWMIMPSLVGHWRMPGWRFDLGVMYHHSFVTGDHSSDFHILNAVRPMRHSGESFVAAITHEVSPRLRVDVTSTFNVSSTLQMGSVGLGYGLSDHLQLTTRMGVVTLFSKLDTVLALGVARAF